MRPKNSLRDFRRRGPTTKPRLRIALVCEGEKTERIYFALFLSALRAANVSMENLDRGRGTDPANIVSHAKSIVRNDKGIDKCFVIFDRDSHHNFNAAVAEARAFADNLKNERTFETIKSYPCFEYWLLIHHVYTRAPLVAEGNDSAGDQAVRRLRIEIPNYSKSDISVISSFLPLTDAAIVNAERAQGDAVLSGNLNPSTEVHILIKLLKGFLPTP